MKREKKGDVLDLCHGGQMNCAWGQMKMWFCVYAVLKRLEVNIAHQKENIKTEIVLRFSWNDYELNFDPFFSLNCYWRFVSQSDVTAECMKSKILDWISYWSFISFVFKSRPFVVEHKWLFRSDIYRFCPWWFDEGREICVTFLPWYVG